MKEVKEMDGEDFLSKSVLQYLADNPKAMDTLDGIAEWWIARHQVRVEVERLARALARLTEDGRVERIGSGQDACYRLTKGTV